MRTCEGAGGPGAAGVPIRECLVYNAGAMSRQGQGRVYYTGLGHTADVFWNSQFFVHLLAGVHYALGDLEAEDSPDTP